MLVIWGNILIEFDTNLDYFLDRFFDLNGPNIFKNYFFDFYFIILSNLSNFSLKSFSAS